MKRLLVFGILAIFLVPVGIAKDKKTLIQRIEETDSIPVYIKLTDIDFFKLDVAWAGVSLTKHENEINNSQHIKMKAPSNYDSLQAYIIQELNTNFKTTRFYAAPLSEMPKTNKNLMDVNDPKAILIVLATIDAAYKYDFMNKPQRNDNKVLESTMKIEGGFLIDFKMVKTEDLSFRNLASCGGFVYGKSFKMSGLTTNTKVLAEIYDPVLMMKNYRNVITERMAKFTQKQYKKYAKATGKEEAEDDEKE